MMRNMEEGDDDDVEFFNLRNRLFNTEDSEIDTSAHFYSTLS
jgi:hypothetical protein